MLLQLHAKNSMCQFLIKFEKPYFGSILGPNFVQKLEHSYEEEGRVRNAGFWKISCT